MLTVQLSLRPDHRLGTTPTAGNDQNRLPVITPKQMRDARTSLGKSRESLPHASGATVHFIHVYEEFGRVGRLNLRRKGFDGLAEIRTAPEAAGVDFIE